MNKTFKLTQSQRDVLIHLACKSKSISCISLANQHGIKQGTVSAALSMLLSMQLITRNNSRYVINRKGLELITSPNNYSINILKNSSRKYLLGLFASLAVFVVAFITKLIIES